MSREDQSWRTAPEPPTRRDRIAALPDDLRQQVEDGVLTLKEAQNVAAGLQPNGEKRTK